MLSFRDTEMFLNKCKNRQSWQQNSNDLLSLEIPTFNILNKDKLTHEVYLILNSYSQTVNKLIALLELWPQKFLRLVPEEEI